MNLELENQSGVVISSSNNQDETKASGYFLDVFAFVEISVSMLNFQLKF